MKIGEWRRFRPLVHKRPLPSATTLNLFSHVDQTMGQIARQLTVKRWKPFEYTQLDRFINQKKQRSLETEGVIAHLEALIIQAPRAAKAQRQMDKHPNGYHNGSARLYELIDFNDAYVSTVLVCPEELLPNFDEEVKYLIDRLCKQLHVPSFSNEQWEAITHGLSREIAVYRGAISEGLEATMTSRTQDAMGVDMVISDGQRSVNIDVKTRSSFHFRLKDLAREGRITAEKAAWAEEAGYCDIVNGHGAEAIETVLLRIDHEELGGIVDFSFENSHLLGNQIRQILAKLGHPVHVR